MPLHPAGRGRQIECAPRNAAPLLCGGLKCQASGERASRADCRPLSRGGRRHPREAVARSTWEPLGLDNLRDAYSSAFTAGCPYCPPPGCHMKLTAERPFTNPAAAARKLVEIAAGIEPAQDGRIHIEKINAPFLYILKASGEEFGAGIKFAVERTWLELHESGTYVRLLKSEASD